MLTYQELSCRPIGWMMYLPAKFRFDGIMVDMLCQIKPEYKKLIWYYKQKNRILTKTLFGKVTKAIYGTLLGARLFYDKLKGILVKMGF